MEKDDGRKLSAPELKEQRKWVIRAYTRGLNKKQISRDIGLSYPAVRNIISCYEERGVESLVPDKKGRKEGENRALSEDQEAQIRRIICEKRPEQLKMEFALWNRVQ